MFSEINVWLCFYLCISKICFSFLILLQLGNICCMISTFLSYWDFLVPSMWSFPEAYTTYAFISGEKIVFTMLLPLLVLVISSCRFEFVSGLISFHPEEFLSVNFLSLFLFYFLMGLAFHVCWCAFSYEVPFIFFILFFFLLFKLDHFYWSMFKFAGYLIY